jgi:hypothetical protein
VSRRIMAKTAAVMRHPMCEVNMPSVIYSSLGASSRMTATCAVMHGACRRFVSY